MSDAGSDESIPKLRRAFPVVLRVDVVIGDPMQLGDDREREDADGRQSLLAVDDRELAVAVSLDHERSHVVTCLGAFAEVEHVIPEVFPLFLRPGVVALVRRHAISLPVADQLQVVDGYRVQDVGPAHVVLTGADRSTIWNAPPCRWWRGTNMGRCLLGVKCFPYVTCPSTTDSGLRPRVPESHDAIATISAWS